MARERHAVAFVLGAAIGGAIGAVYGLLHAPRTGIETRIDLTERWHDVEERTAHEIADLQWDFRRSLESAARIVEVGEGGLLVIVIDAADNAVIAAEPDRECFVPVLWQIPLPENCMHMKMQQVSGFTGCTRAESLQ